MSEKIPEQNMSDPKHTPGPWHVGCLGSDSTCQCSYVLSEWYMGAICTVHVDNGLPIGEGGNDAPARDQAIANMHLIAAAPDLLEVVKSFVAETVDYMTLNKLGDPERQHNVKWARQVIAKAESRAALSIPEHAEDRKDNE